MKLIKILPTGKYCVVEGEVEENISPSGQLEVFERFLKTWVMETKDLPKELLQ